MKIYITKEDQQTAKYILEELLIYIEEDSVNRYYRPLLEKIINAKDEDEENE